MSVVPLANALNENELPTARVIASLIGTGGVSQSSREMSTDLPAFDLGELVAEVLLMGWQQGEDPTQCTIVLTFR